MSSILSSLKLTSAKRQQLSNPIEFRRQKLSNKLKEQVALAVALKNGETYTSKRLRTVTDSDGIRQTVEVSKRVKPIWFTQNNKVFVQVRYGSKVVPLTAKELKALERDGVLRMQYSHFVILNEAHLTEIALSEGVSQLPERL